MMKLRMPLIIVVAAAMAIPLVSCRSKPKSKAETLVEQVANRGMMDVKAAKELQAMGEPAIKELLKACFNGRKENQLVYAHLLVRIDVEPARFNACVKLLNEHKDKDIRSRAVDGLARDHAPEEAIKMAIDLALNSPDPVLKASAERTVSFCKVAKFDSLICKALRQGLSDPDQTVREHAQLGLDRRREMGFCQ